MPELKKKQHYVWSEYLRAWAENDRIWTFFIHKEKTEAVQKTNLINVAQEKFFYKLVDLSTEEEEYLSKFISNSHWTVRGLQMDFLSAFSSSKKLRIALQDIKSEILETKLIEIEANLMEDTHLWIENDGQKLISCRSLEDLKFLDENDLKYKTLIYVCLQYFRTKKTKDVIASAFKNQLSSPVPKAWNILSFIIATNVAMNISLDPNTKFILLENRMIEKFITSDQPIINLLGDHIDEGGNVLGLEFYYPLSPNFAILIHSRSNQSERYIHELIDKSTLLIYNSKMRANASSFIFSHNRNQLDEL